MKLAALIGIIFIVIIAGCSPASNPPKGEPADTDNEGGGQTLDQYYSSIDYSCRAETDCAVKNVGNCCGEYLQCVNKNSRADPAAVAEMCAKEGSASVCIRNEIPGCECKNSRCEPKA